VGNPDLSPPGAGGEPAPPPPPLIVVCGGQPALGLELAREIERDLPGARAFCPDSVRTFATEIVGAAAPTTGVVLVGSGPELRPEDSRLIRLLAVLGVNELTLAGGEVDAAVAQVPAAQRAVDDVIASRRGPRLEAAASAEIAEVLRRGEALPVRSPADPREADRLRVTVVWLAEEPLLPGRAYGLTLGGQSTVATVNPLRYRLDLETGEHIAATKLETGELGVCDAELREPLRFTPYRESRRQGAAKLLDIQTGECVGLAMVEFALRRASNISWQRLDLVKRDRAASLRQQPAALWLTGLSGAGKSTLANLLEAALHERGHHTYLLDGDNVRHGLNADLGFTDADRVENVRRVAEVARLMVDAGLIVIVSFISPFRAERDMARSLFEPGEFFEVHVDAPLAVAEQRDAKGLYAKARRGQLANFTGIDSPYEAPVQPEVRVDTARLDPEAGTHLVLETLELAGRLELSAGRRTRFVRDGL
jgi:bifunctional enzyme CysN/CysC